MSPAPVLSARFYLPFYPPGFTAEDAAVIALRWKKEEPTWESRVPRVQRGFECAGISSVCDSFVSLPLGNGAFSAPRCQWRGSCAQLEQGSAAA